MNALLLTTKLYIPPTRAELVPRPRLVEQLQASLDRKLRLVSAPAGFGKTTLLSEVVRNFLEGTTQVLGESPGTTRLDGGKGMDRRAVYGRLSFIPGQNPSEVP